MMFCVIVDDGLACLINISAHANVQSLEVEDCETYGTITVVPTNIPRYLIDRTKSQQHHHVDANHIKFVLDIHAQPTNHELMSTSLVDDMLEQTLSSERTIHLV